MADLAALERGAKSMWSETSTQIQSEYGQDYFDQHTQFMINHTDKGRDNPEEVVDAMMDAITAVKPQIRYKVCGFDYYIIWLLSDWFPFSIADYMGKFRAPKVAPSGAAK